MKLNIIAKIKADIKKIQCETYTPELGNFDARANAIDFIEFHIIDRIEGFIRQPVAKNGLIKLLKDAKVLKAALEAVDNEMFTQLEAEIILSKNRGAFFKKIIKTFLGSCGYNNQPADPIGYDNLDLLMNRLLSTSDLSERVKDLEPEMIFYQKTPARIILELSK